jgi:hypothetical protein
MASTSDVAALADGVCPHCGSRFARDLKGRGFQRHLECRPKQVNGQIVLGQDGPIFCGGTADSWGKGMKSP